MPPRLNKYDRSHLRNLKRYQQQIDAIYDAAIREAVSIGGLVANADPDKIFSFADYPITHDRVRKLLGTMAHDMEMCIVNGVRSEWTLANNKNNVLCDRVFGDNKLLLPFEAASRYYTTNGGALEAFLQRQVGGLNLSDRVWRYTDAFQREIELGLDLGIRSGQDARSMARDLKQYLRFPDKLFRRVRDEHGELQLSKAAAAFHPGRGVYRSSYKNALRLAGTECNIAYRTADHERWQQIDFVVGQEVCCSDTNHPVEDICDTLAGRYPKDFKFVGWHPNCRCYVIPVLKTDEEVAADCQRILRGEDPLPSDTSENAVEDVPAAFNEWVEENAERTSRARQLPYFIADNPQYVQNDFGGRLSAHKEGMTGALMLGREDERIFGRIVSDPKYNVVAPINPTLMQEAKEICSDLGIDYTPMTLEEADMGTPNVSGDRNNCQSAVVVYEARRRGINITANPFSKGSVADSLGYNGGMAFVDKNGQPRNMATLRAKDKRQLEAALKRATSQKGRYHLGMNYGEEKGHIIVVERLDAKTIFFYCPQKNERWSIGQIIEESSSLEILKVDNLCFNRDVLKAISSAL